MMPTTGQEVLPSRKNHTWDVYINDEARMTTAEGRNPESVLSSVRVTFV